MDTKSPGDTRVLFICVRASCDSGITILPNDTCLRMCLSASYDDGINFPRNNWPPVSFLFKDELWIAYENHEFSKRGHVNTYLYCPMNNFKVLLLKIYRKKIMEFISWLLFVFPWWFDLRPYTPYYFLWWIVDEPVRFPVLLASIFKRRVISLHFRYFSVPLP